MGKKLYRSRDDRMLAGVCGGLAEYFGIDTTLVRVAWVLVFFLGGSGFIAYIICYFVFPEEPKSKIGISDDEYIVGAKNYDEDNLSYKGESDETNKMLSGGILIILGIVFLVRRYVNWFNIGSLWPIILIIIGFYVLYNGKERS